VDTLVPVHLRHSIIQGVTLYVGNLNFALSEQLSLLRQILRLNFEVASADAEMRLFPDLPSSLDDYPQQTSPLSSVVGIRPPSHRGVLDLPKVTVPAQRNLKDVKRIQLSKNNLNLLDNQAKLGLQAPQVER